MVVARDLVERVLGDDAEVLAHFPGSALAGTRYEPPFAYIADYGPRGHTVLIGDFVSTEDGTGIVHTAIAFGEDDFRLGEQYGIKLQNPVLADGTFDERITDFAGRGVKDADPRDRRGAARARAGCFGRRSTSTPIRTAGAAARRCSTTRRRAGTSARPRSATGCWPRTRPSAGDPTTSSTAASASWLEGNVDWALSRERYWGTPLPIWECESADCDGAFCAGSIAELRERAGEVPDDLHRPYIDDVARPLREVRRARCAGSRR